MRLPQAVMMLPLALYATHAIDVGDRRVRGLQKEKGKDDKWSYDPQSLQWDRKNIPPPPPPPLFPPTYAPQTNARPPTISPVQRNDDNVNDDYRGKGKGKGIGPPVKTDDNSYDDAQGKGKGKGKGATPPGPDTDDYYAQDDRGGKGKGKGVTDDYYAQDDRGGKGKGKGGPPPPPPPPPPGKGKGKGSSNKKSKSKKEPKKMEKGSSKKNKSKMTKNSKKSSSKAKGKGKGKGFFTSRPTPFKPPSPKVPTKPTSPPSRPPSAGPCNSAFSSFVLSSVPEAIVKNPVRCCDFDGATAAIVTHAQPDNTTTSGFEPFWNNLYDIIDAVSKKAQVCFFMTGYNPSIATGRNLSEVLIDVNQVVSTIQKIPSMMSTDPTDNDALISEIRKISSNPSFPSIGVFNAGYENIQLEKLESGLPAIPYVGYMEDQTFGREAAQVTRELLGTENPIPICFNARIGSVPLVGKRCQAYYSALQVEVEPAIGVNCSASSTSDQILAILLAQNINTAWTHIDCCMPVAQAAQAARELGRNIVVGCQDDARGAPVDFVTRQPETLQGYATSTWANFPVMQALQGRDGRSKQYFPSLSSIVNTAIYSLVFE